MGRFKNKLFLPLILLISSISVGCASFILTIFDSNESDQLAVGAIDKDAKIVVENYFVRNGNQEENAYASFSSLESALTSAKNNSNTSQQVNCYILPSQENYVIENKNIYIPNYVSVYLPYNDALEWNNNNISSIPNSIIDSNENNVKTYRKNYLQLINTDITVEKGGGLYIGGEFRTLGISRNYSEIGLDKNSSIIVNGTLINYGYIKEIGNINYESNGENSQYKNEFDPNRYIEVNNGGYLKIPMSIYDMPSTANLSGYNDNGVCPVNEFDFPNLQTYLKVNYGAIFETQIRAYLTTSVIDYPVDTYATLIADETTASQDGLKPLFILNEGSISFEYCPKNPNYTAKDDSKTYIILDGNVKMGSLYFDLDVAELDTSKMFLPISYKLNIVLDENSSFSTDYKLKFLAGSILKVLKNASVNINSEVIFYKSNSTATINDYPTTTDKALNDATFINNGKVTFTSNSKVGGHIITESTDDSAYLDFANLTQDQLTVSSNEGSNNVTYVDVTSTGVFYLNDAYTSNLFKAGEIIYSDANGLMCWGNGYISSFNLTVIINNISNYDYPTIGYEIISYDSLGNNPTYLAGRESQLVTDVSTLTTTYTLEMGTKIRMNSYRSDNTYFSYQSNSNYEFKNGEIYDVVGDLEVTINPGKGILMRFSSESASGNGGCSRMVLESLDDTYDGEYRGIASATEVVLNTVVKENSYFKYSWTPGDSPVYGGVEEFYKFEGLQEGLNDESKTSGEKVDASAVTSDSYSEWITSPILADNQYTLHVYLKDSCLLPGALIAMADGSYKLIEDLKLRDMVKSFSFVTGQYENQMVIYYKEIKDQLTDVITLYFDDGSKFEIAQFQSFFDMNKLEYFEINTNNYKDSIGKQIMGYDNGNIKIKTITDVKYEQYYTTVYEVITSYNYNFVADNTLTVDPLIGDTNLFEITENLTYDFEQMQQDIATYGLYTYEDFKPYATEEQFELYNVKYLKIAVGKGFLTFDFIVESIERYRQYSI